MTDFLSLHLLHTVSLVWGMILDLNQRGSRFKFWMSPLSQFLFSARDGRRTSETLNQIVGATTVLIVEPGGGEESTKAVQYHIRSSLDKKG